MSKSYKLINRNTIISEREFINAYEIVTGKQIEEVTPEILLECKGVDAEVNPVISRKINVIITGGNLRDGEYMVRRMTPSQIYEVLRDGFTVKASGV